MNTLNIAVLSLLALSSCAQTASNNKKQISSKDPSQQVLTIYTNMTAEVCNCTSSTMKNDKPSTTLDSCYKAVVEKYTDTLKAVGYDPASSSGQNMLSNEIRLYLCKDLYSLMEKEWSGAEAKKLLFKGEYVSQKKLGSGEYEVTFRESKTKELKLFKSKAPFDEKIVKNFLSGYELTIEYEIVKNSKTKTEEFYIKQNGTVSAIGATPVSHQK